MDVPIAAKIEAIFVPIRLTAAKPTNKEFYE
jgi:hypothetical protein